jgi:hypothetical protein
MIVTVLAVMAFAVGAWLAFDLRGWSLIGVELLVIATVLAVDRIYDPQLDRWARGARGEESVGAILDELRSGGWYVIHDLALGRGNIDHVLVGPGGVFAVETKSHRGRISLASTRRC